MPAKKDVPLNEIKALVLGDVIGKPGTRALFYHLKKIIKKTDADLVIANGENAFEGSGLTPELVHEFFKSGVDVITSGNHIWRKKEIYPVLDSEDRLLRPENYPKKVPGKGFCTVQVKDSPVSVLNLEGKLNNARLPCPFQTGRERIKKLAKISPLIIVDFHAEMPQEKEALALYLDGEISALVGTHTHVQTADERILPGGTAYMTDIGMTGPADSVIGVDPEVAIKRLISQMPLKMEVVEKPAVMMGVLITIDVRSGKATTIERFKEYCDV
jgi:metallophosphoesterase (TIGR00282 family)